MPPAGPNMKSIPAPTTQQIDELIRRCLEEDLGSGDVTTRGVVAQDEVRSASVTAKQDLILCGAAIFRRVFTRLDAEAAFPEPCAEDGDAVAAGKAFLHVWAKTRALLEGERTALNILQRLSGIATLTRRFVEQAAPVTVLDTRKTTPGLRVFEKYAVRCGGGTNHRFGLYDGILIKDNHIRAAGSVREAVARLRNSGNGALPVEVETADLDQVREAVDAGADILLLDNMEVETVRKAVEIVAGRAKTEVSGSMTLARVAEIAGTGADFVSVGALTHSAPAVDISMNIE